MDEDVYMTEHSASHVMIQYNTCNQKFLKPQDNFGRFVKFFLDLQKVPSESSIKPTSNCFE